MSGFLFWIGAYNALGAFIVMAMHFDGVADAVLRRATEVVDRPYHHEGYARMWMWWAAMVNLFMGLVMVRAAGWPAAVQRESQRWRSVCIYSGGCAWCSGSGVRVTGGDLRVAPAVAQAGRVGCVGGVAGQVSAQGLQPWAIRWRAAGCRRSGTGVRPRACRAARGGASELGVAGEQVGDDPRGAVRERGEHAATLAVRAAAAAGDGGVAREVEAGAGEAEAAGVAGAAVAAGVGGGAVAVPAGLVEDRGGDLGEADLAGRAMAT
ncbi:MAG: hypothetical protein IPO88_02630 [Nannocystis sp.]|uniref:hypothetical protein n=1 Tax=Nannocystis sp. TaxID=1962667 RepID=UPI002420FC2B|nr:hypothetical protein [Nannocystis sp.]MBK9752400.1 hypothetical protein [Nannocystis sp.]